MFSILEFEFMRKALLVGFLLGLIIPCIGIIVILKRLSMIGDALSHASLAGVAAGLILNINPIIGAMSAAIAAALGIEVIRKRIQRFSELSIAIIMSAGIGLAGVLSGFTKNSSGFDSFLFGSIVAIDDFELYSIALVSVLVLLAFVFLYRALFYIALDERGARLSGVPTGAVNFIFTILTAITVSVAGRTVGALIVSSLMVVPVVCAMQFGKSFKMTVILSICFAVFFMISGLLIAFYASLKPGGTIVLTGIVVFLFILAGKKLDSGMKHYKKREIR